MTRPADQHVILCEGYDDRSFWKGWLLHLNCVDPTEGGAKEGRDAWGLPVKGKGRYLFDTPGGSKVIVEPLQGRPNARRAAREWLGGRQARRPTQLVLNLDSDAEAGEDSESAWDCLRGIARSLDAKGADRGPFSLGDSTLSGVTWECADPDDAELPRQQTLERLVTASIRAAFPERGPCVRAWLDSSPLGETIGKSYGYSYLAKWYPRSGPADFYEAVWDDEPVCEELRRRLTQSGAWATVAALVAD